LIGRLVDKPLELQWEERQSIVRSPQWFWRLWGKVRRRDYLTKSVSHKEVRRLQLVFVYDELDKVEPQEAQKMLNALKPLLLSSKATFIFIGGYEFAHQWLARTQPEGDMPYGLFSDVIYVPLYTDSELNKLVENLFQVPPDGEDEDFQTVLDHVKLHCVGTPREFFRQLLQFVQWRDGQALFDTCQKEALFSRLLPYVQEVNSKISSALPQEVRDELTRRTYEWLMMAEREATFSLSVLFTRPEISGMWQQALSEHFKKFCDIMVEGGVFQPVESETEEQYCFNPEFSLGTWRRPTAVSPAPEELRVPVLSLGPFEAPPGVAYFVDRETELRTIRQALETGIPLIQVVGMAGIGKTALVTRIAHDMRNRFPDGVLWISLEPGMTLENVLHHIALSYGKVLASAESEILAAQVRALLADKKALIVLDAAENLSKDTLEQILPGTRNCSMIVTTRTRFPLERLGQTITLDVLSPDASISLLKQSAGYRRVSSDRDAALKVCQILGHHPLAIEVAGRLALSRDWTMQSLLENLQLSLSGSSGAMDPVAPVTAVLSAIYDLLSGEEKRALTAAAIFEGDFDPTGLAYVADQPEGTTIYLLDNLVNRSLILRSTGQSYRLHPLVRAYVRRVTEESTLQEMHRRHAQYFLKWVRAARRGK
jgi:predicted ATPase